MPEFQGQLQAKAGMKVGIVVARFNEVATRAMLQGAKDCFARFGMGEEQITTAWVPGAVELPFIAKKMAHSGQFDAVICIGCVIQGETKHFDFVAAQASSGVGQLNVNTDVPVIFGVITTDTLEQAIARSGSTVGNKGFEAAMTAIEMVDLATQLDSCLKAEAAASPYAG